jgi:hypothetical protein
MATDGPDPTPCSKDIYENGTPVFMTSSIPSNAMERWVKAVAKASMYPVDWHFAGGRAVVLTTGDVSCVRAAIEMLLPEHDRLYAEAVKKYGMDGRNPPRYWFDGPAPGAKR